MSQPDKKQMQRWRFEDILGLLAEVSDFKYQRGAWTGEDHEHRGSFSEVVNGLFDDAGLLDFIEGDAVDLGISEEDRQELRTFASRLGKIADAIPATADVYTVQADLAWGNLSADSAPLLKRLNRYAPEYDPEDYLGKKPRDENRM